MRTDLLVISSFTGNLSPTGFFRFKSGLRLLFTGIAMALSSFGWLVYGFAPYLLFYRSLSTSVLINWAKSFTVI